jgi:hypothetical protein
MVRGVIHFLLLSLACVCARAGEPMRLKVAAATVSGGPKLETIGGVQNIGFWTSIDGLVVWKTNLSARGTYRVIAVVSCPKGPHGAEFVVDVGNQRANGIVPATGSWTNYVDVDLGPVILRQPGPLAVIVRAIRKPKSAVMNLREIRLVPE